MVDKAANEQGKNIDPKTKATQQDSKTVFWLFLIGIIAYFAIVIILYYTNLTAGTRVLNAVLMDAAFISLILTVVFLIIRFLTLGMFTASSSTTSFNGRQVDLFVILFQTGKFLSLASFLLVQSWILFVSPFSIFGGSLYGFAMQVLIAIPLLFILMNFWVSGNLYGLFLLAAANILILPLSFTFPTLFANFYSISTGSSAAAGGAAASTFAIIDPMSYYRSSVLKQGRTEPVIGPTYEGVTDDVIGVDVEISGRMCDSNDIIITARLDNEAKYTLSNVWVQFSPMRDVYLGTVGINYDFCNVEFPDATTGNHKTFSEEVSFIARGAPATVSTSFTTFLPADILTQVCNMRTDVILAYHTTAVFPLTLIDYNLYQQDPENIGTPVSTSSFGKIRIDMSVGQQPIPVKYSESGITDNGELLLKIGWAPKDSGSLIINPELYLFLPGDLGGCTNEELDDKYRIGSLALASGLLNVSNVVVNEFNQYTGMYVMDKTRLDDEFFECWSTKDNYTINEVCSHFPKKISYTETTACNPLIETCTGDAFRALSWQEFDDDKLSQASLAVPGIDNVCEELIGRGYVLCHSKETLRPNDLLLCQLNLDQTAPEDVNFNNETIQYKMNEAGTNTYLIRADATYEFHSVSVSTYNLENCDAI